MALQLPHGRVGPASATQDMQYQPAELENYPGYHIRRLQQIAVAVFMEETEEFGVTPVQYAALSAVLRQPGIDQRTLARNIGFDTSTIGGVIDRLERRGLIERRPHPSDGRAMGVHLTPEGVALTQQAEKTAAQLEQDATSRLTAAERKTLIRLLQKIY